MRFVREIKEKITTGKLFAKIKNGKNVEIVIAVILALIAAVSYFLITAKGKSGGGNSGESLQMNDSESRLAAVISEISGVGKANVMITTDEDREIVGVVVVMEGAEDMGNRVKVIRCVEKATGATVDKIEIFEMTNGG